MNPLPENLIVPLRELINKRTGELTVQDVLSMTFHSVQIISTQNLRDANLWNELYIEHIGDIKKQSIAKWPKPMIRTNRLYTRRDLDTLSHSFHRSSNFLTLLMRLIYLEVIKNATDWSNESINVLGIKPFDESILEPVRELTVARIFYLVRIALLKYVRVYNDSGTFENELGMTLLGILSSN
jgi:hypothetical protein